MGSPTPRRVSSSATAIHTVGTPAATVTSSSSMRSIRVGASKLGPLNTCLAPTRVAPKGMPQALTWNIGTTARTLSAGPIPMAPPEVLARACRKLERWVYTTPLGRPSVPEV